MVLSSAGNDHIKRPSIKVACATSSNQWTALVDRGANGCIAGGDMRVMETTSATIDLSGIDDHTIRNLKIVKAGGVTRTPEGEVLVVVYQAAHMSDGRTILSAGQMEWFKNLVDDRPKVVTGKTPTITTPGGNRIPISIRKGLPYIKMRPYTDEEKKTLPQVILTSPHPWDPTILDSKVPESWYTRPPVRNPIVEEGVIDVMGNLKPSDENADTHEEEIDPNWAVDRKNILVQLSNSIRDELVDDFTVCDIDGRLHEIRWDYQPLSEDECDEDEWDIFANTRSKPKRSSPRREKPKDESKASPRRRNPRRSTRKKTKSDENGIPKEGRTTRRKKVELPPGQDSDESSVIDEEDPDSSDESDAPVDGSRKYNNQAKQAAEENDDMLPAKELQVGVEPRLQVPSKRNLGRYTKYFPGTNLETLKKTFEATTQYGTRGATEGHTLRNQITSPNPILNIPRRHEEVATDTLYSDSEAIDDGSTAAQFFIGRKSHFRSVRPLGRTDKNFPQVLFDEIRKYGAMDKLISDNAKAQVSARVQDILRTFAIKDWQSEPYKGNQNFAERGWKDTKTKVNSLLNASGADPEAWLLALEYVCFVQNHTAVPSLGNRTPIEWMLGYTPDISVLLQFCFWEPVLYKKYDEKFPSDSTELLGRFVGIAENVGHGMTYKILTEDNKIIHRAVARSGTKTGGFDNKRAKKASPNRSPHPDVPGISEVQVETVDDEDDLETNETPTEDSVNDFIKSAKEDVLRSLHEDKVERGENLPTIDSTGLLGRTFLPDPDENGEQTRAKVEAVELTEDKTADGTEQVYKFRCRVGEKTFEHVMTYNKMLEWCDRDLDKDDMFKIDTIHGHKRDPKAAGGYLLNVGWASGERSWEELTPLFNDDPVSVSLYAMKNDLLHLDGFKRCKKYTKNTKKLARMINQARLKSYRNKPVYQYGYQVPRNHDEAVFIDERMGNTKWQDAEKLELKQLFEYDTFKDLGMGAPIPDGYQKIPCHMVYAVKHDGRHKARMVAGGHRTGTPIDSTYSSVVSLPGLRLVTFLAELNELELWGTDIGNAYLESYTKEKVCFIAGGEFGELAGHTFMIIKAQYGLKSSGRRWHEKLFDALTAMGFKPSKAEEDIWMRDMGDHYEYIASYVDDLAIASRNPQAIINALEGNPNNFKLKGTGKMTFHLGCDYFRDSDGTLCVGPRTYVDRMVAQYVSLFGCKPKMNVSSPLEKNDHPELDDSELLNEDDIIKYQSLIGVLQWAITLGRFDIGTAVMTMSGFRVAPRQGHLERVRRICGYLAKMKQGCIRVRTGEPDYSGIPEQHYDWARTVYGNVEEVIPNDIPTPKGKRVITTAYVDANLYHDLITGRSVTGVLHFVNQTPVHWFSKKQATVETATYGSEFVAAKQAVEQIMAMRTTLRYLGVEVHGQTYMFGDNGSVVTNSSIPESPLRKRHQALAYHFTREAIAAKVVDFRHIPGTINPSDLLSKHWGYAQIWPMLRTMLFWSGDTSKLLLMDNAPSQPKGSDKCSVSEGVIPNAKGTDDGRDSDNLGTDSGPSDQGTDVSTRDTTEK